LDPSFEPSSFHPWGELKNFIEKLIDQSKLAHWVEWSKENSSKLHFKFKSNNS
jgi:hypothetical protein